MGTLQSEALDALKRNALAQYSESAKRWKASGGKIMGLAYAYIPEEIFDAAGFLPYRLRAFDNDSMAYANARFQETSCTLVRRFYDEFKRGGFEFCDAFATANACDHERRLLENADATMPLPHSYLINFPKKIGEAQVEFYAAGLRTLIGKLENDFGVTIGEAALRASIEKYNRSRRLQRKLYELRRKPNPPISGSDALAIAMARTSMPIDEYCELLEEVVERASAAEGISDYKMRVFVYAGEIDNIALMQAIESQGALIVGDYMGYGLRACRMDVPNSGDAVHDLATFMVMRCPDPRQWGTMDERQQLVVDLTQACNAQGIVFPAITFCDHWTWEQHNFGLYAKQAGVPVLDLDVEYVFNAPDQVKTRVQAFVEANGRN